jgi:hypothetical protein
MEANSRIGIKAAKAPRMQTLTSPFDSGTENSQNNRTLMDERPLKICVVFDQTASADSAEVLITHVTSDIPFEKQTFRFDELTPPNRNKASARKVADTDILVLAARGDQMLPTHIRFWLGLCLTLRDEDREGALVALITKVDGCEGLHSSILEYLEAIAIIGRVAYFQREPSRRI